MPAAVDALSASDWLQNKGKQIGQPARISRRRNRCARPLSSTPSAARDVEENCAVDVELVGAEDAVSLAVSMLSRSGAFALLLVSALSGACLERVRHGLTLSGSTSLQPLAERWAEVYQARHAGPSIAVQGGGSTAGVQAALSGAAQIGMLSRALTASELREVHAIEVARDGIALIVHPSNSLEDLSLDAIRRIYSGDVKDWKRLQGTAKAITVITREEGSGTRAAFEGLVMGKRPISSSALVQDSTGAVRQMVSTDPAAIGYISIGLVDASVKALRLSGVAATEANIDNGTYPLVRPFLFAIRGEPTQQARAFISWVSGPEGRDVARREGMLPPSKESADARR